MPNESITLAFYSLRYWHSFKANIFISDSFTFRIYSSKTFPSILIIALAHLSIASAIYQGLLILCMLAAIILSHNYVQSFSALNTILVLSAAGNSYMGLL